MNEGKNEKLITVSNHYITVPLTTFLDGQNVTSFLKETHARKKTWPECEKFLKETHATNKTAMCIPRPSYENMSISYK